MNEACQAPQSAKSSVVTISRDHVAPAAQTCGAGRPPAQLWPRPSLRPPGSAVTRLGPGRSSLPWGRRCPYLRQEPAPPSLRPLALRSVLQLPTARLPPTMALLHSSRILSGVAAAFHPGLAAAASARAR